MRKILGPQRIEKGYVLHSRKTTETMSNLAENIRKPRLKFYGHIKTVEKIKTYIQETKMNTPWIKHVKRDLEKTPDSEHRKTYRPKINEWKMESEKHERKIKEKLEGKFRELLCTVYKGQFCNK